MGDEWPGDTVPVALSGPRGSSKAEEGWGCGWGCGWWLHRVHSPASEPMGSCLTEVRGSELFKLLRLLINGPMRRQQNS